MAATDLSADDRTFRVNFTVEGAERLRETVKEKLREFMGEYTDDTLVEYVIVLLRNGRRKDEARKELNVFLGDDCDAFIFWLWDHLSTSLPLYVESKESLSDETAKTKSGRRIIQLEHVRGRMQPDSEYDNKNTKSTNDTTKRRNREWKGLVQEVAGQFSHQSTLVNSQLEDENNRRPISPVRQSPPRPQGNNRKRGLADEPKQRKRDRTSQPMMAAPRRLLQFAVRDAVSNVQQTISKTEPALKRLRSVVSTTAKDSILDEGPVIRSVARASGGLSTALKAAAEAAEDAIKVRYSSTVFDRLGNVLDKQEASGIEEPVLEGEINDFERIGGKDNLTYYQKGEYAGQFAEDTNMLDGDTELASDSASYNDGYADVNVVRYHQGVDVSGTASSANKNKGSTMVQYTVGQDADEVARNKRIINQNIPAAAAASASRKIVNISVNVNTYESPSTEVVEKQNGKERSDAGAGCTMQNVARADVQKEVQNTLTSTTGSYTTARPSDVDSRTVFVSNVHFAATKDNLSRHFNKFGEVLKVIIVTDAATGQPKGSAYVEFLRKESVELALSLNGTSFMSRIIKVVRRSSAHHDPSPTMWWPRAGRVPSYAARLGVPFPRGGVPMGAFRARLTVKPGARSLQWKRGSPGVQTSDGARSLQSPSLSTITSGNNVLSPTGRNLTYIRKET